MSFTQQMTEDAGLSSRNPKQTIKLASSSQMFTETHCSVACSCDWTNFLRSYFYPWNWNQKSRFHDHLYLLGPLTAVMPTGGKLAPAKCFLAASDAFEFFIHEFI